MGLFIYFFGYSASAGEKPVIVRVSARRGTFKVGLGANALRLETSPQKEGVMHKASKD